jgi:hypothetical protein
LQPLLDANELAVDEPATGSHAPPPVLKVEH